MVELALISNVRVRVSGLDKVLKRVLDEAMAEEVEGAEFSENHVRHAGELHAKAKAQGKKAHIWDGRRHLFVASTTRGDQGTIPLGLLPRCERTLRYHGTAYRVIDERTDLERAVPSTAVHARMLHGITLRDYQVAAARAAVTAERGILDLATNAGKTAVSAAIIRAIGLDTLYVVPNLGLLNQSRADLANFLGTIPEEIGVIRGGVFSPKAVTIATLNSVAKTARKPRRGKQAKQPAPVEPEAIRRLKRYLATVRVVFLDEGHHGKANTWFRFMRRLKSAQFRYLQSGTPFGSGSPLTVESVCGPVLYTVRNKELIERGFSARPIVHMVPIREPRIAGLWGSFDDVYKQGVVNNITRNTTIARLAVRLSAHQQPAIVLVRHIVQGEQILDLVHAEGGDATLVHASVPGGQQAIDAAKDRFKHEGGILIASPVFGEGQDIPACRVLVIGDAGKSFKDVLQKIGRGLRRKHVGTNTVTVIDFADMTHPLLSKHSLERYRIYTAEEFDVREGTTDDGIVEAAISVSATTAPGGQDEVRTAADTGDDRGSAVSPLPRAHARGGAVPGRVAATAIAVRRTDERAAGVREGGGLLLWRLRLA